MRIAFLCLAATGLLAACNQPAPATGPSDTRGLPTVQGGGPAAGAGGVAPIERPAGSRGGDKGS